MLLGAIFYTFLMLEYFFNQLVLLRVQVQGKSRFKFCLWEENICSETCAQLSHFYIFFTVSEIVFFKYNILLCIKPTILSLNNVKAQFFPVSATEDMCLTTHSSAWIPGTSLLTRMPATTRNRRQLLQAIGAIYYKQ
jgi:hypothetical protein